MNRQETFDKIVTHLLMQGKPATKTQESGSVSCVYRGDEGTMCAIGCLIPDEKYSPQLEGRSIGRFTNDELSIIGFDPSDDEMFSLLRDCQRVHDYSKSPYYTFNEWILTKMKVVADVHGLVWDYDPDDWV